MRAVKVYPSIWSRLKILFFFFLFLFSFEAVRAESALPKGKTQISGGSGAFMKYFVAGDYAIHDNITIGMEFISRDVHYTYHNLFYYKEYTKVRSGYLFTSSYHFNSLFNMSENWDYYLGLGMGYYNEQPNGFGKDFWAPGAQMGFRYFPATFFGLHAELAMKDTLHAKLGVTLRLK